MTSLLFIFLLGSQNRVVFTWSILVFISFLNALYLFVANSVSYTCKAAITMASDLSVRSTAHSQTELEGDEGNPKQVEKREEEKLKSKYPNLAKGGGGSALLNKRLHKGGQKYFDSGDYAMAKAKLSAKVKPPPPPEKIITTEDVGMTIPTPENIHARKPSLVASKLASGELT